MKSFLQQHRQSSSYEKIVQIRPISLQIHYNLGFVSILIMKSFDQLFPTLNTVAATGTIRTEPEDFVVKEMNDVVFTEKGEHLWLLVEKTNSNTAWVATQVASACKVPARQVGFAGQKDRHAVTYQWFSVQLPKITDLTEIKNQLPKEVQIIEHHWHQSKIKKGQLKGNAFQILIRDIIGDESNIEQNIERIKEQGVPNYFGPQRFGHDLGNIQKAQDWFAGKIRVNNRNLRSLLISSARSHIFNLIVAERIKKSIWNQVIDGDIMQLNGSHSWFHSKDASLEKLDQRLEENDIHLTAAMWGEDPVQSDGECADLEQNTADQFQTYKQGFQQHRVKQDRRAIRVLPEDFNYQWTEGNQLQMAFKLPAGAFATGVLREIFIYQEPEHTNKR